MPNIKSIVLFVEKHGVVRRELELELIQEEEEEEGERGK